MSPLAQGMIGVSRQESVEPHESEQRLAVELAEETPVALGRKLIFDRFLELRSKPFADRETVGSGGGSNLLGKFGRLASALVV